MSSSRHLSKPTQCWVAHHVFGDPRRAAFSLVSLSLRKVQPSPTNSLSFPRPRRGPSEIGTLTLFGLTTGVPSPYQESFTSSYRLEISTPAIGKSTNFCIHKRGARCRKDSSFLALAPSIACEVYCVFLGHGLELRIRPVQPDLIAQPNGGPLMIFSL